MRRRAVKGLMASACLAVGVGVPLSPALADGAPLILPPGAALVVDATEAPGRYPLPTGPWADGALPVAPVEGTVVRQVWRIEGADPDGAGAARTLGLLVALRDQLVAQGFDILLDCATEVCGGFDFRFATEVVPPPDMYVDLGEFLFVSARRGPGEAASLLVSRSGTALFVQIVRVTPDGIAPWPSDPDVRMDPPVPAMSPGAGGSPAEVAAALDDGRAVLSGLDFDSGAAALGPGPFESLAALSAYMDANPGVRVALVGHTDATGTLDGNIALSRQRAQAVLDRLVRDFAVPRARLDAQGVGYLAPLATNLTPEGREVNRRVEAIVLPAP